MPFTVKLEKESDSLKKDAKVLLPISLGQKYHLGERLKALVEFAKSYNTTILIADALHRYNLNDEKKALSMGDKFLDKNAEAFKDTVLIDSVESWEKYKDDAKVVKLVRWKTWAQIKQKELEVADRLIEEECKNPVSKLVKKLHETAKQSASAHSEESSIAYQKEENKYLLTFSEFDYHIYPKPLNPSQAETYTIFESSVKLPVHKSVKFENVEHPNSFFAEQKKRHEQSLPLALRLLINNFQEILGSSELSPVHKTLFIAKVSSMLTSAQHEIGQGETDHAPEKLLKRSFGKGQKLSEAMVQNSIVFTPMDQNVNENKLCQETEKPAENIIEDCSLSSFSSSLDEEGEYEGNILRS
jgi:hypothetical protein